MLYYNVHALALAKLLTHCARGRGSKSSVGAVYYGQQP